MRWSRRQDSVKTAVRQCPGCRTDRKMRRKKYLPRAGAARQPDVSRAILHNGVRKEMQMPRRQEQGIHSGVRRRGHPPRVTRRLHKRELSGIRSGVRRPDHPFRISGGTMHFRHSGQPEHLQKNGGVPERSSMHRPIWGTGGIRKRMRTKKKDVLRRFSIFCSDLSACCSLRF